MKCRGREALSGAHGQDRVFKKLRRVFLKISF